MKKLSKLKLVEFHEMSNFEMKNVVGGYSDAYDDSYSENPVPQRCKGSGCLTQYDCGANQMCATHQDCDDIPTYGKARCF